MERELPHNIDAERALLGSLFTHNEWFFDVAEIVTAADFFEPGHGEIFKLMQDMIGADRAATPITMLADMSQDRDIGGIRASEYLRSLYEEGVPGGLDQVKEIARAVYDNALARRMISAARGMIDDVMNRPTSMGAAYLREKYDAEFGALFPSTRDLGIRHIAEFGDEVIDRTEKALQSDTEIGMNIGLKQVQDLMGALVGARLYSIAGGAGSGKSALAQQILEYVTRAGSGKKALWIQAEMQGEEVAARSISAATGITGANIERAMLNAAEVEQMIVANRALARTGVYVDQASRPTVERIRAKALRMKRGNGLDVLCVDHLLYMGKPNDRMSDIEAIPHNMSGLKAIAKDLDIPVMILMPLKSSYMEGDLRRPRMSDLTHPAAIDQNSDVILFIHRPEYILGRNGAAPGKDAEHAALKLQWEGKAEALLMKRRGGESTGARELGFSGKRVRFSDNVPSLMKDQDQPAFSLMGEAV